MSERAGTDNDLPLGGAFLGGIAGLSVAKASFRLSLPFELAQARAWNALAAVPFTFWGLPGLRRRHRGGGRLLGRMLVPGPVAAAGNGGGGTVDMKQADLHKLLHGPYRPPKVTRDDRVSCLYGDCDLRMTGRGAAIRRSSGTTWCGTR